MLQLPSWKHVIYIAGTSRQVHATTALVRLCSTLNGGAVGDLETVLKWWSSPEIPAGNAVVVSATEFFPAIRMAGEGDEA